MKKILIALALFTLVSTLAGCKSKSTTLTILTSSGYEPYEMIDQNGTLIGFDIDLMHAIADYLELDIEFKDVDFDGIIASLQMQQADAAIAGITPTKSRGLVVDFSDIYYNSETGLKNMLVHLETDTIDNLDGLTIGAQLGTIQAEILEELSETLGFNVELRTTNAALIQELKTKRIDALLVEQLVASSIKEANDDLEYQAFASDTSTLFGNAIALPKNSELLESFNEALIALKENGTLEALVAKWFD